MAELPPTGAQQMASDPNVTAWVSANAGSGKTRVLTQRVARLLLAGADPSKILCLTYTKAAAAEMQARLFRLLGDWAMRDDATLGELLGQLGGRDQISDPALLRRARRLFARALETPGGLKIQTIHAFCDSLLRRFPLEAGISPGFEVIDERQAALMLYEIRDRMAADAEAGRDAAFDRLAKRLSGEDSFDAMVSAVLSRRDRFAMSDAEALIRESFGPAIEADRSELISHHLERLETKRLVEALGGGSSNDQKCACALKAMDLEDDPLKAAQHLFKAVLVKDADRGREKLPTKKTQQAYPWSADLLERAVAIAIELRRALKAYETAARTRDLYLFARALLDAYAEAKSSRALLDFDDLIERVGSLLRNSEVRAWVLYKLDLGIEHVLVDEAQDTSPAQWEVIAAITDDFHAEEAQSNSIARTVFVVGDEKQSIYSFQGAQPEAFGEMRTRFAGRLSAVAQRLQRPDLITSFRSSGGILDFVDKVFAGEAGKGVTYSAEPVRHNAHRAGDGSRVDLWPLIEPPEKPKEPEWWKPVDRPHPDDPKTRLAKSLAGEIRRMIGQETLPARSGRAARPVLPGDILVLVRKRDRLARGLIQELKSLDVPVAGADRLTLAEELAVKDILSLIKAVLLTSDDLSLAEVLRSPLGSFNEEALFELSHFRDGTLWEALMASGDRHRRDKEFLADLARNAGYLAPYEFLERILINHDGRRRLLARLGAEAEDAIDELIAQALAYEAREVPSLAGFVAWIEAGDIALKREMEKGAGEVRVMTIHGAKGLEAPIVILPDTVAAGAGGGRRPKLFPLGDTPLTLWAGPKAEDDPTTATAREAAERREAAEAQRLLYVGLTRAEDWLILAGAGRQQDAEKSWYAMLESAVDASIPEERRPPEGLDGPVRRLEGGPWPEHEATPASRRGEQSEECPGWISPVVREPRLRRLSPSRLTGDEPEHRTGGGEAEAARLRGLAVHHLLERLPGVEEPVDQLAPRLVTEAVPGLSPDATVAAVEEALSVLRDPRFAEIFGPGSLGEVAVSFPVSADQSLNGRIDRVIVASDAITLVDFKTDRAVPSCAEEVPVAYNVQIGAYATGLAGIYPGRLVRAAILWTSSRELMEIPQHAAAAAYRHALARIGVAGIDLETAAS